MKLSLVIPCRDETDPKLRALLRSIGEQDFQKEEVEILVIREGTSESAKAIGIRKAVGEVIGILASDNELVHPRFLKDHYEQALMCAAQPTFYHYRFKDNPLNRYFALMGCNDPLAHYMGKKDKWNYTRHSMFVGTKYMPAGWAGIKDPDRWGAERTIGDNGYFVTRNLIEKTDLDNYYHIDNANEAGSYMVLTGHEIWHKTGGNIFKFFAKRYRYGLQHAFNKNRRWHLVDFKDQEDIRRLIWFIVASITIVQPLILSCRGYLKIRDRAWFLHPVICLMATFTYTLLAIRVVIKKSLSLFVPSIVQRA